MPNAEPHSGTVGSGGNDGQSNHHHHRRRRQSSCENFSTDDDSQRPPFLILEEIVKLLIDHTNNSGRETVHGTGEWRIQDVTEAKSAQQQVYILKFERCCADSDRSSSNTAEIRAHDSSTHVTAGNNDWKDAITWGRNRLVLRIWKGGSRWWNLNRNEPPFGLAQSEIKGYHIARTAFEKFRLEQQQVTTPTSDNDGDDASLHWVPKIPRVLHFHAPSLPNNTGNGAATDSESSLCCWAVLEYVGEDETDDLTLDEKTSHVAEETPHRLGCVKIDRSYLEGMIKIRKEFGFDEPHPRWGRVPVEEALGYARLILNQVILPLHRYSRQDRLDPPGCHNDDHNEQELLKLTSAPEGMPDSTPRTFFSIVQLYRQAWKDVERTVAQQTHNTIHGSTSSTTTTNSSSDNSEEGCDDRTRICLQRLDRGICVLERIGTNTAIIPPLDPVLVHLDLQPQNLIFSCGGGTQSRSEGGRRHQIPSVFSVLDWEDAAWADPRFDLILLCRKVCANREQADALWSDYATAIACRATKREQERDNSSGCGDDSVPTSEFPSQKSQRSTSNSLPLDGIANPNRTQSLVSDQSNSQRSSLFDQSSKQLGPIEPWLRLETVHSITTMLLQSMDLVNGGRNPWETKKDLWGKLKREFTRLEGYDASPS